MSLCEHCGQDAPAPNDSWCKACILEAELIMGELEDELYPEEEPVTFTSYTRDDLERWVESYEEKHGIDSETLLLLHQVGVGVIGLDAFDRHVWLSYYRELQNGR